jgi:phenylacetate-CoA ligase
MNKLAERIYQKSPVFVQNLLVSGEGLRIRRTRYGGNYRSIEEAALSRWALSKREIWELQGQRLQLHLRNARGSEYWREAFDQYKVNTEGSDPFSEIAKLPVLEKATVRRERDRIINRFVPSDKLRWRHTSGTTGSSLTFPETLDAEREQWAIWWRYRYALGITRDTWSGHFGGRTIVNSNTVSAPYWRLNIPGKQVLFSAYHLTSASAGAYVEQLRRRKITWMHGYPSFIAKLAEYGYAARLDPGDVCFVTTGAENLLVSQREKIEKWLGVRVRQHYGLAEAVVNMSEREDGAMRIDEDFSYVELVPITNDRRRSQCAILGTNVSNAAFPLFRYNTGDQASVDQDTNHWRRIVSIDGRKEDYVVMPNGAYVGRLDHIFKDLTNIVEAQIEQTSVEEIVIRVVKGVNFALPNDEKMLLDEFRARLGTGIRFRVHYVDKIERTAAGKLRFVISSLAQGRIES